MATGIGYTQIDYRSMRQETPDGKVEFKCLLELPLAAEIIHSQLDGYILTIWYKHVQDRPTSSREFWLFGSRIKCNVLPVHDMIHIGTFKLDSKFDSVFAVFGRDQYLHLFEYPTRNTP